MPFTLRAARTTTALLVWLVTIPAAADAQDAIADIKRELAALRAEVQQLRGELDVLKREAPAAPASLEILQTQVAELAQTRVESTSRAPVKLFGTVHGHFFTNSGNANWLDIPNLTLPPATPTSGTTGATLRQTRIGLTSRRAAAWRAQDQRRRGHGLLRRRARIPDRTGDGPGAAAGRLRADRRRADRSGGRTGSDDPGAARSDVARGVRIPAAVPFGQPLSARAAGARRISGRGHLRARPAASSRQSAAISPVPTICLSRRRSAASDPAVPACRRGLPT